MRKLLALVFCLIAGAASAQLSNLPPNTVVGRLGAGTPGPAQAIPFNTLSILLGGSAGSSGLAITRAQIPTTNTAGAQSLILTGYRTNGDLGFGAPYTCVGQSSTSWLAVKDNAGNWCALNLAGFTNVSGISGLFTANVGWFGAFGDGASHQIAAGDITANPEWRGIYSAGTEWDAVAIQEAMYLAFATLSSPGNVSWNVNTNVPNLEFFNPPGFYEINTQILSVVNSGKINFGGKATAKWTWTGPQNTAMWLCNSCAYTQVYSPFLATAALELNNDGTVACTWQLDNTGSPGGLLTQQDTIYDAEILVPNNGRGLCVNPTAQGGGQGDTITLINPIFIGNPSSLSGLELWGGNTLQTTITGGDFQGFSGACAINVIGGSIQTLNTHFENQLNQGVVGATPVLNQINTNGGDVCLTSNSANLSGIYNARSEGEIVAANDATSPTQLENANVLGSSLSSPGYFASAPFLHGIVVGGATIGTKQRAFMVVDAGGNNQYRHLSTDGTGTIITDSSATFTTNQWAGFDVHYRFSSNGFTKHCVIASNTATTITLSSVGCLPANVSAVGPSLYTIGGHTNASSPPSWDGASRGYRPTGGTAQGVFVTAGSNVFCYSASFAVSNNDYIIVPGADQIDTGGPQKTTYPLYAKVLTSGTAASGTCASNGFTTQGTLSKNAALAPSNNGTNSIVFGCTPLSDGDMKWCNVEYDAIGQGFRMINNVTVAVGLIATAATMLDIRTLRSDWLDPYVGFSNGQSSNINLTNIAGAMRSDFPVILGTTSGTVSVVAAMGASSAATLTPNGATTLNAASTPINAPLIYDWTILVTSNGTPEVVTFGSNFTSNGPVNTGSVNGAITAVHFRSSLAGAWQEVSRNIYGPSAAPFIYSAAGTALPSCTAANKGARATVSDAGPPASGSIYATGGTLTQPVICNGTNWLTNISYGLAPLLYSAAGTALPSCAAGTKGVSLTVSDATAPTYNATYTSGGTVLSPVTCDGTNWKTH